MADPEIYSRKGAEMDDRVLRWYTVVAHKILYAIRRANFQTIISRVYNI